MKELLILSGKGGAGKTSISACFAQLAHQAVLVDCDVDASNLPMLLEPEQSTGTPFYCGLFPRLDPDQCVRCGKCQELCAFRAISGHAPDLDFSEGCEGCGVCADHCAAHAITLKDRLCGHWYCSSTPYGNLYHAELLPGGENSGKLIAELRKHAREDAVRNQAEWIISDGPPGIGCPVISASTGADYAVVVTEPTLSGLHDMQRLAVLLNQFEIPFSLIINKADINPENTGDLEHWCGERQIPIIGRIPFDPVFSRALSGGKTVLSYGKESLAAGIIQDIWNHLHSIIIKENQK